MWDGQGPTEQSFKAKIHEVKAVVAAVHGLPVSALESACRKRVWAIPRQEAMKLARELTGRSFPAIARAFGDRDHTTALYADRKVTALEATDPKVAARLTECRARIAELVSMRIGKLLVTPPHGSSTEWTPPPPMQISKPDVVVASIDLISWKALGGELVAA
jgi:hypothetical protein